MTINFRVEFESTPIRHVAVQCPHCNSWFNARDITKDTIHDKTDLMFAPFYCPVCKKTFSVYKPSWSSAENAEMQIEEVGYPDVYKDCLTRKETWE